MPRGEVKDNPVFEKFAEVRDHFLKHPDSRCIPLFLNSLGEGDGHGTYQRMEEVLLLYPKEAVIHHLIDTLRNGYEPGRIWVMQICSYFPDPVIRDLLFQATENQDEEIRVFAWLGLQGQELEKPMESYPNFPDELR